MIPNDHTSTFVYRRNRRERKILAEKRLCGGPYFVFFARYDFRGHPVRSAHDRRPIVGKSATKLGAIAEICYFYGTLQPDQDVVRLDISMDDRVRSGV